MTQKKINLVVGDRFMALDISNGTTPWAVFEIVAVASADLHMEVRIVARCGIKEDAERLAEIHYPFQKGG